MSAPKVLYVTNYGTRVVTSMDGVMAAVALYQAALRVYGVSELAELSRKKQELLIEEMNMSLDILGIRDVCIEWREEKKELHVNAGEHAR